MIESKNLKTIILIGLIILSLLILTGCGSNSYSAYKQDCLDSKRINFCHLYPDDSNYCAIGSFKAYKQAWIDECRLEYSNTQTLNKEVDR